MLPKPDTKLLIKSVLSAFNNLIAINVVPEVNTNETIKTTVTPTQPVNKPVEKLAVSETAEQTIPYGYSPAGSDQAKK